MGVVEEGACERLGAHLATFAWRFFRSTSFLIYFNLGFQIWSVLLQKQSGMVWSGGLVVLMGWRRIP